MVPLGIIFQLIKQVQIRHAISIIFGFVFQYFLFENELYVPLVQTLIVYVLIITFKERCGKIVFYESFLFLVSFQTYKMITEYTVWRMSVDMALMMDTAKYTIIAFNISDGLAKNKKLNKEQEAKALKKIPSFIEYFSYIQFFASSLMGPIFEYSEFNDFINLRNEFAAISLRNSLKNSVKCIGQGFAYVALFIGLAPFFPVDFIDKEEFGQKNMLYKLAYLNISILFIRFRYYGGFLLCESSNMAAGLAYNGKDPKTGEEKWDRVK